MGVNPGTILIGNSKVLAEMGRYQLVWFQIDFVSNKLKLYLNQTYYHLFYLFAKRGRHPHMDLAFSVDAGWYRKGKIDLHDLSFILSGKHLRGIIQLKMDKLQLILYSAFELC